jgi:hypothetical protein
MGQDRGQIVRRRGLIEAEPWLRCERHLGIGMVAFAQCNAPLGHLPPDRHPGLPARAVRQLGQSLPQRLIELRLLHRDKLHEHVVRGHCDRGLDRGAWRRLEINCIGGSLLRHGMDRIENGAMEDGERARLQHRGGWHGRRVNCDDVPVDDRICSRWLHGRRDEDDHRGR